MATDPSSQPKVSHMSELKETDAYCAYMLSVDAVLSLCVHACVRACFGAVLMEAECC